MVTLLLFDWGGMGLRDKLKAQRAQVENNWRAYQETNTTVSDRAELLESWERSKSLIDLNITSAPTVAEDVKALWVDNVLSEPVAAMEDSLNNLAEEGGFVVAVTDVSSQILWTTGSSHMRNKAEKANFAPGSDWGEAAVGTNALDLALRSQKRQSVFSAEHFAPLVHGWVCYAAPIFDNKTNTCLGVIDLSTTWDNANPLAIMAVDSFAELLSAEVSKSLGVSSSLKLEFLGPVKATRGSGVLNLPRRQFEILFILSQNPQGLSLEALHDYLYGENSVSLGTLKSELSHLRSTIGESIKSRPYRLADGIVTDYQLCLRELKVGQFARAMQHFNGELFPASNSPYIDEKRQLLMAMLHSAAIQTHDIDALIQYLEYVPHDLAACEHLASLVRTSDPRFALCQAVLKRAEI